jgi:NADP-dependent 3-hydroxy acid dehydrogenase YdfG
MTNALQGKVALITGASSGIGEATALAFAEQGAHVVLVARRQDRLQDLSQRIEQKGVRALPIAADASNEEEVHKVVQQAKDQFGRLDIVVNNAGVMLLGKIDGANTDEWRQMININVLGLLYMTHSVLPIMKEQQSGHIVNISSVAGRTARMGSGVYNVTKWGVVAFSESLRQEVLSSNIRVTTIEPGAVATELDSHISDEQVRKQQQEWVSKITPLASEDIANAIVYAVTQPQHVDVNEILIRPTQQER